jgi:hypothetical protein
MSREKFLAIEGLSLKDENDIQLYTLPRENAVARQL